MFYLDFYIYYLSNKFYFLKMWSPTQFFISANTPTFFNYPDKILGLVSDTSFPLFLLCNQWVFKHHKVFLEINVEINVLKIAVNRQMLPERSSRVNVQTCKSIANALVWICLFNQCPQIQQWLEGREVGRRWGEQQPLALGIWWGWGGVSEE